MKWWGFPNYLRSLDDSLPSWTELDRGHGRFGNTCKEQHARQQCGSQWVCRSGICSECVETKECDEKFTCVASPGGHQRCVPRDLLSQWNWHEVVATALIIFTAMLSAAAGMGGGGVYVPLLLLLLGFSAKEAVPLSQAMIVGGAVVNIFMFSGERHPKNRNRPRIDYEVVMMLNPTLATGVTLGVICHLISPQWLIVTTLIITLVLALQKTVKKGLEQWRKESAALADGSPGQGSKKAVSIKMVDFRGFMELANQNSKPMTLILGCWATFLALNVMKAPQCSSMYWLQLGAMVVICGAFTVTGARVITGTATSSALAAEVVAEAKEKGGETQAAKAEEGALSWTPTTLWLYPLLSLVAGFLGGFLGIGGGIIMSPMLLELGMLPEVNQATTAMFVFLSSSLATIQFVVLGKTMPQYVTWFMSWVVLSTVLGQTLVDYLMKRSGRSSLIVLSIGAIILGSLVMMTYVGSVDIYDDLVDGAYMGFSAHKLCER